MAEGRPGAADGGDKLTARFGPRLINVEGDIVVYSAGLQVTPVESVTGYLSGVNALVAAWVSGLETLLNSTFTLGWTPTGQGASSLTCTYGYEGAEFQSTPSPNMSGPTTVTFGLVAESG